MPVSGDGLVPFRAFDGPLAMLLVHSTANSRVNSQTCSWYSCSQRLVMWAPAGDCRRGYPRRRPEVLAVNSPVPAPRGGPQ
jgi:hypothetical protein